MGSNLQDFSGVEVEDADFQAVANPSNTLILPEDSTRGSIIEFISRGIPTNEFGLPVYYIRSDLLDINTIQFRGSLTQDEADMAADALSYQEGFPTFSNGTPFWLQMPHEPRPTYLLFQNYLALDELEGIRLVDSLAQKEHLDVEIIRSHYQEYYWSARARAYDLFIVAAEAKKREALTRKTENKHFQAAGQFLEKVIAKINSDEELINEMDGKELFDLFEQLVKVQRLSLGLTGQNASSTAKELNNPGQTVEFILRNLTKNSGLSGNGAESFQNRLALLMQDENTAMQAQELIIRATSDNIVNSQST